MQITTPTTPFQGEPISVVYYNEGGSVMVLDKEINRSFFIDHRIGTNTRGQIFETVKGERIPVPKQDVPYVAKLIGRASDQILSKPTETEWKIKRRYFKMLQEIFDEALQMLSAGQSTG